MKYFLKHQTIILRSVGLFMLLIGFIVHFWLVPPKGVSPNERAAINLARMEASVSGSSSSQKSKKSDASHYAKAFKETQKKQVEYFTIIAMILGIGSLGYSFVKKKEKGT